MNKYEEGVWYIGDIVRFQNGKKEVVKPQVYLGYDEKLDTFFELGGPAFNALYYSFFDKIREIDEKMGEYEQQYLEEQIPHSMLDTSGNLYVDDETILQSRDTRKRK